MSFPAAHGRVIIPGSPKNPRNTAAQERAVRTFLPVKVNEQPLDCPEGVCTTDISEMGMFVRTAKPFDLATRLSVQIDLRGQKLGLDAVVVHSFKTKNGPYHEPGMGLEFLNMTADDKGALRAFIRSQVIGS